MKRGKLENFKHVQRKQSKKNYNECFEVLRTYKRITEREYNRLYPTGSKAGTFYGNAKVHKLRKGAELRELTLRPIFSNVGTATYNTAKYLANFTCTVGKVWLHNY